VIRRRRALELYLREQNKHDAELRKILRQAAEDAARHIASLSEGKLGPELRRAQLRIAQEQIRMWREIGVLTEANMRAVGEVSAEFTQEIMEDLYRRAGLELPDAVVRSMRASARRTIEHLIARQVNGIKLSERVMHNARVNSARIDRIINSALLRGANAKEIAKEVSKFISPRTPGGVSYAAQRIGRSEINNAFHQASISQYQDNPTIEGVQWNLSSSHPEGDICDTYADETHFRGGEPGVYKPDDVPAKPHPQCFCYITPVTVSVDELITMLKSGRFQELATV
jgi:hypothetical protein